MVQYFVVGDFAGDYFVDVIDGSRIASELDDDGRAPYLPTPIHQARK